MIARFRAIGVVLYDLVVGDDWRLAVGVIVALAITYGVSRTGVPAWWILPGALGILLPLSLWRATRKH